MQSEIMAFITFSRLSFYRGKQNDEFNLMLRKKEMSYIQQQRMKNCKYWSFLDASFSQFIIDSRQNDTERRINVFFSFYIRHLAYISTLQVKVFAWSPFGNQLFWFRETFLQIKLPAA